MYVRWDRESWLERRAFIEGEEGAGGFGVPAAFLIAQSSSGTAASRVISLWEWTRQHSSH